MLAILVRIWNNYKEYIILSIILIIALVLVSFSQSKEVKTVKTTAFGTFAYLTSAVTKLYEPFQTSFEVQKLREENARLMLQVNQLREHGIQNEELKSLINYRDSSNYPLVPARIVSKYVSSTQGNFIINAGSDDNVKIGMPVINNKGLIGIVFLTEKNFSIVRTLNNRELKFAVKNQRSRFDGIIEWNGTELIIRNVPKTYDMEIGDIVITSDFSTKFPPNIPVGEILGGTRDKTGIFNNITVKPLVDFTKVEHVFIVQIIPSVQKKGLELNLLK